MIRTAVINLATMAVDNIIEFEGAIPDEHHEGQLWLASDDAQIGDTWDGAQIVRAPEKVSAFVYDWRSAVWANFRHNRATYLARLSGIAGIASRKGHDRTAQAADDLAQGLLDLPHHDSVQPAVTPDVASLELAIAAGLEGLLVQANDPGLARVYA
jgi:hypothetical protein